MKEMIITGIDAYTGNLFTVKKVALPLPDGKEKVYEMIDIQNAVTIFPIDEEKNVYFVEQFRIGAKKKLLELPAGKVEKGEDPLRAAQRELREEIGMDAAEFKHLGNFYMTPGYANEYMYCYLATGLFHAPLSPDSDEFINVRKMPLSNFLDMIKEGLIEDSKTLAVMMLAQHDLE